MNGADLEAVYEALAAKLDAVGEAKAPLYLAKLALLLAHQIEDPKAVLGAIDVAALSLPIETNNTDCLHTEDLPTSSS